MTEEIIVDGPSPVAYGAGPDSNPDRPLPMEWDEYCRRVGEKWIELLDSNPEERSVQKFLELHPSMIPGGSGDVGPGGHHGSQFGAVFREPELAGLGDKYRPDFMWITRSSSLITPILIEIEKPSKRWFKKDGVPTSDFTQARNQLAQWRSWFQIDSNPSIFRQTYMFEDLHLDRPLAPQFVLIYGRGSEFTTEGPHEDPAGLRLRRDGIRSPDETIRSFDSLTPRFDHRNSITVSKVARKGGLVPFAFSPVYQTDAFTGEDARILGDPKAAFDRTDIMMSQERKDYLAGRWDHWKMVDLQENRNVSYIRSGGFE